TLPRFECPPSSGFAVRGPDRSHVPLRDCRSEVPGEVQEAFSSLRAHFAEAPSLALADPVTRLVFPYRTVAHVSDLTAVAPDRSVRSALARAGVPVPRRDIAQARRAWQGLVHRARA